MSKFVSLSKLKLPPFFGLWILQGINPNSQPMRKKKIEKTHAKENNHTHKIIFRWFGNLPTSTKLQRFHYYQGKIQSAATVFFFFFFLSLSPAWAYRPKLPFHGLTLRKSLIKNHVTLFGLGRVIKPDQTKLGSTKPNKSPTWRLEIGRAHV